MCASQMLLYKMCLKQNNSFLFVLSVFSSKILSILKVSQSLLIYSFYFVFKYNFQKEKNNLVFRCNTKKSLVYVLASDKQLNAKVMHELR